MPDRFVVRSTKGARINPAAASSGGGGRRPLPHSYYVLDSAICYELVAAFEAHTHGNRFRQRSDADRREAAESVAAELNVWAATA
jgi:hypothetical protein